MKERGKRTRRGKGSKTHREGTNSKREKEKAQRKRERSLRGKETVNLMSEGRLEAIEKT